MHEPRPEPGSETAPRSAPPTTPGLVASRSSEGTPASARHAIGWSIGGVILFPLGIVGIVCGAAALRRIRSSERRAGTGLAVAGIVLGIADLVLVIPLALVITGLFAGVSAVQSVTVTARAQMHAVSMHQWALSHARQAGAYPGHVAELALEDHGGTLERLLTQYPSPEERAGAGIDGLDLLGLADDTAGHDQLRAALAGMDRTAPTYTFCDHTYVRLPAPTSDPRIVFSYRQQPGSGYHMFTMDDGSTKIVSADGWDGVWAEDAAARAAHGLPEFTPD